MLFLRWKQHLFLKINKTCKHFSFALNGSSWTKMVIIAINCSSVSANALIGSHKRWAINSVHWMYEWISEGTCHVGHSWGSELLPSFVSSHFFATQWPDSPCSRKLSPFQFKTRNWTTKCFLSITPRSQVQPLLLLGLVLEGRKLLFKEFQSLGLRVFTEQGEPISVCHQWAP